MSQRVKELNNHSLKVGSSHYDNTKEYYRGEFVNLMSIKEGESSNREDEEGEEQAAKRQKREEKDSRLAKQNALKVLQRSKERRFATLSAKCRLLPKDRHLLQTLIHNQKFSQIHVATVGHKFPSDGKWRKLLYRFLDGGEFDDATQVSLDVMEMNVFKNILKEIENEIGHPWEGSKKENELADLKVAISIKNSFANYEKNKSKTDQLFFKF